MKKIALFIIGLLLTIPILVSAAGGVTINKTSLTIDQGSTATFTVTANNSAGKITISSSDPSVISIDKTSEWLDEESMTVTVSALKAGDVTISIDIDVATYDEVEIKETKTISVTVNDGEVPGGSSNANLSDIKIDDVSLSGFSSNATTYNMTLDQERVAIAAVVEDENAHVTGVGMRELSYGLNTIPLVVTAEDGVTKKTYTLNITRADNRDTNNYLESLTIDEGSLIFDKNTLNYEVEVEQGVTTVHINATAESDKATVTGTGSQSLSGSSTTLSVVVTAENGSKRTYKIVVVKSDNRDSNNYLKSLSVDEGSLVFNKNTTDYIVYVSDTTTSVHINATAESDKATVTGTGVQQLGSFNNEFSIVVKAENETTRTYKITIVRSADVVLTYDSNKGSMCTPSHKAVTKGQAWGELCTPKREGYSFDGWFTAASGGTLVTASTIASADLTVYAQWTKTIVNPNTGLKTPVFILITLVIISVAVLLIVRRRKMSL